MSTTPLVITDPVILIGGVDFSDAVMKATLHVDGNEVEIPATFATPIGARRGSVKYSIELEYFSNDTSATAELFGVFWTAATDPDGSSNLTVSIRYRQAIVSATNPCWSATMVILATALGGSAGDLSTDSQTFPLTGKPVRSTT